MNSTVKNSSNKKNQKSSKKSNNIQTPTKIIEQSHVSDSIEQRSLKRAKLSHRKEVQSPPPKPEEKQMTTRS
jgi:hypothetical protein